MYPAAYYVTPQEKTGCTPLVIKGLLGHEKNMKQILLVAHPHPYCEDKLRYTNEINIKQLVCAKTGQDCSSDHQGPLH